MTNTIRLLSASDVKEALPMKAAVAVMKKTFAALSSGKAGLPLRTSVAAGDGKSTFLVMPALLGDEARMAVKVLSFFPGNAERGLPLIQALLLAFDGETGRPLGLLEAGALTALRTGAASGAATDLLARGDASRVALFGAGVQARSQLEAVLAVRSIEKARVFDPAPERAAVFARETGREFGVAVEAAPSPRAALDGARIVCTATTSPAPVFDDADLAPGAHINAVGAFTPAAREIPGETAARARVFVDHRESCLAEAGDLLIPMGKGLFGPDHISGELGEVAAGTKAGRTSETEITLFKSVGVAVQDAAAAAAALDEAERRDIGLLFPLGN